jgi:hypothetical protein
MWRNFVERIGTGISYHMRKIYLLFAAFFICLCCTAQTGNTTKENDDPLFEKVEYHAEFPFGADSLKRFLGSRFVIPNSLLDDEKINIRGTITASFTIEKDGTPSSFKIVKPLHPVLDNELLGVLRMMPRWKPAMQNGIAVVSHLIQSIMVDISHD